MRKKILIKRIVPLMLCGLMLIPTTVSAADSQSKDVNYYSYTAEEIENSIPSIKNNANWRVKVLVEEAEKQGVKVDFRAATRNMRVEIPVKVSLDGLHGVFSDLQVTGNPEIAFIITERQAYSDYVIDPNGNALARLPVAISLKLSTGEVTCHTAMALSRYNDKTLANEPVNKLIGQSDNLKAENLAGKTWDLFFNKIDNQNWQISIAGEKFDVKETDLLDATSEIDLSMCYMAISAWHPNMNTMSFVINSCHSGESTCADDPKNANMLKTAADTIKSINKLGAITYSKGKIIKDLYNLYSNMSSSMQSLVTNSDELMEAYQVYQVVEQIHELGTITLGSNEKINNVLESYGELSDELKVRVSNLSELTQAQKKYIELKLKEYVEAPDEVNEIYKDRVTTITSEDVEQIVDVDGGMETTTVNEHITTTGGDGTQYLWIMFVAAGAVVLVALGTFFFLRWRNKKTKVEVAGNEEK